MNKGNPGDVRSLSCVSIRLLHAHQLAPLLSVPELDAGYADLQHASFGLDEAASIAQVINQSGRFGFVRLDAPRVSAAQALQQAGTEMLLVPGLQTPGDMAAFAQATRASLDDVELRLGWMVESMTTVESIDDILAQESTAFVMVGCTDLQRDAMAHGVVDPAYVEKSLRRVVQAAHRIGKRCMVGGTWRDAALLSTALQERPWLITIGSDATMLCVGARNALGRWRAEHVPEAARTPSIQEHGQ
jgi:2-keto-3-deoxy-L-rhamnonate aldolase RhmA